MNRVVQQGLRVNAFQFGVLVLVNAFVGGMVGMERSILPEIGVVDFGMESHALLLSFIVAFGLSKALANYLAGRWADWVGRKRLLVLGWLLGLPVPLLLMYAPSWDVVIWANVLLGMQQGLTWSSTVVMKIDLVGRKDRGLAMGINEFSGYLAVGLVAYFTAYLADEYGLRPYPFYLGLLMAVLGLLLSVFVVRDTRHFVDHEEREEQGGLKLMNVFWDTTFRQPVLRALTQAGLVNNLNDGMMWGLLPVILLGQGFEQEQIGLVAGVYPMVWGIAQLFTGRLADRYSNRLILFWGMLFQAVAIFLLTTVGNLAAYVALSVLLGLGTALVYPTFFVALSRVVTPGQRAEAIGVFRLWRDSGYAVGALLSGLVADWMGPTAAVILVGGLTLIAAFVVWRDVR